MLRKLISRSSERDEVKQDLSIDDMQKIINDVFLSNYLDKKIGNAYLVGLNELNVWMKYFSTFNLWNFPKIKSFPAVFPEEIDAVSVNNLMLTTYGVINNILLIGDGKLSLCGGALINILTFAQRQVNPDDFDIFFHCASIEEADVILYKCMGFLKKFPHIHYVRNQYVQTVGFTYNHKYMKIQFIRRIYKSKDQILLGFDLAPSRFGYNPRDGFFSTICGAISFAMRAFPVDLTQRSLSHGRRLNKYMNKGFNVLLPGIRNINIDYNINTPDGTIKYIKPLEYGFRCKYANSDYESVNDGEDSTYMNWYYLLTEKYHNIGFASGNMDDIYNLTDNVIESSIKSGPLFDKIERMKQLRFETAHKFLDINYKEFALALYIDRDFEEANRIWVQRWNYYTERAKKAVKLFRDDGWKVENPGSQYFGKFNPVIADPREWYGKDYYPLEVGINMEQFQALMDCIKNIEYMNIIPYDVFKIICEYWVVAEAIDARKRLLDIK